MNSDSILNRLFGLRLLMLSMTMMFIHPFDTLGQDVVYTFNQDLYHNIERLRIKYPNTLNFHPTLKYYQRNDVFQIALRASLDVSNMVDHEMVRHLILENNEYLQEGPLTDLTGDSSLVNSIKHTIKQREPIWGIFYKNPSQLISISGKEYYLRINPLLDVRGGMTSENNDLIFRNRRGLSLRGGLNDKFYFYTEIIETQERYASYVNRYILEKKTLPGQGFFKQYESSILDIDDGYDYLNAIGYLGINFTEYVGAQLGHGKHFIGNGYRSLLLSDFANNYFYLKLNWRFGRVHYQNLWSELRPNSPEEVSDGIFGQKYMATHHLSINLSPTLNVGIFESVVFDRSDQFELGYLNPIILFRAVEQAANSEDNVLIGFDFNWDFLKRGSLYGQIIIDEFKLDEMITNNRGWWGNKFGYQVGAKYLDIFGVDNLDIQLEWNSIRPYTYTHRDSTASYSHFNQALAHPNGANLNEALIRVYYQPIKRIRLQGIYSLLNQGLDELNQNWGGNILLPHGTREQEYDNEIGQGEESKTMFLGLRASYELMYNFHLDLSYFNRNQNVEKKKLLSENIFSFGVRWNLSSDVFHF